MKTEYKILIIMGVICVLFSFFIAGYIIGSDGYDNGYQKCYEGTEYYINQSAKYRRMYNECVYDYVRLEDKNDKLRLCELKLQNLGE